MSQASSGQVPGGDKQTLKSSVLLTGATGFIGRRLLPRLVLAGFRVRCLVRSEQRFRSLFPDLESVEVVKGDARDKGVLDQAMHNVCSALYLIHSICCCE